MLTSNRTTEESIEKLVEVICGRDAPTLVYIHPTQGLRTCYAHSTTAATIYRHPEWIIGVYDYGVCAKQLKADLVGIV